MTSDTFDTYVIFLLFQSDLKVVLKDGRELKAHKFVLDSRSNNWDKNNLSVISELDLSGKNFSLI